MHLINCGFIKGYFISDHQNILKVALCPLWSLNSLILSMAVMDRFGCTKYDTEKKKKKKK